jgi:2-methylcitrate dehydratase PrpD
MKRKGRSVKGENGTETLAGFAEVLSFENLRPETVNHARLAILDAVACGLAGATDEPTGLLIRSLVRMGEEGTVPLFGRTEKLTPRAAALANGALIHALEMDDTHSFSSVHAGGPIVSAALSACASGGTTGKRFIEAVVAGYDVACRLGTAMRGNNPYHRGFHPTGICGVFGAAAACGKLIGLESEGFLNAWGTCGSMAAGLMAYLQNGAWTKKIHPGWAAQSGFLAAMLARDGYLGPHDIFEGLYSFPRAYSDHFDCSALLDDLGERFEVDRMSFKKFSCCRTIHAPMTAALDIRSREGFRPGEIEEIHVTIAEEDLDLVVEPLEKKKHPRTTVEARFSMPFGLALVLVEGEAMPGRYTIDKLRDPLIRKLCEKFEYEVSDGFTRRRPLHFPCDLKIRTTRGWFTASVNAPLGDYTNPLSEDEMKAKFRDLSSPALGASAVDEIEQFILSLEDQIEAGSLLTSIHGRPR